MFFELGLSGEEYFCEGVVELYFVLLPLSLVDGPETTLDFFSGVVEYTFLVFSPSCPEKVRVSRVLGLVYSCFDGVVRALGAVYVLGFSYLISGCTFLLGDRDVVSLTFVLVPSAPVERVASAGLL